MNKKLLLPVMVVQAMLLVCCQHHLIGDHQQRKTVLNDFLSRSEKYSSVRGDLFSLPDRIDGQERREALQFMLAYMPLNDLAVYTPESLLANVDAALRAREEMKWGKDIPDGIFLHFVLPQRVNNENLDSFRLTYYDELKKRIMNMSAKEAALEVNHWCHEKVAYQPSDIRTSAPLATILSARGRCGEESTFTVSALRMVGLPARQIYTPRWAHSDDNHAWVEVWVDGAWYYMGACEPEPVLDRGWFTEPARRAMLTKTKSFGRYTGDEAVVISKEMFSEINTLKKYAETKDLAIRVLNDNGEAAPGANVDYLLYNCAELYPLASLVTDENGSSKFTTGKGSLVVWASLGDKYGFVNVSATDDSVTLYLSDEQPRSRIQLDLFAPEARIPLPGPPEELVLQNAERLKKEDSIRQAYIDSWMKEISIEELATETGIDAGSLGKVLGSSMGNYNSILSFIRSAGDKKDLAMRLLNNISQKDLRDTPASVLADHLNNTPVIEGSGVSFHDAYVLSPRIDNEILTPFRGDLIAVIPEDIMNNFIDDPEAIAAWVDSSVTVVDNENHYDTPLTPAGVERLRTSDSHSRDIFFVALARTAGHPARLEPGTGRPQYYGNGDWCDVWFSNSVKPSETKGYVTFVSDETNPVPQYSTHFTLARFIKGRYKTLLFDEGVKADEMPENIALDPGSYMLVTGNRNDKGNVLCELDFFELNPGEKLNVNVRLRHEDKDEMVLGKIEAGKEIKMFDDTSIQLSSLLNEGMVIFWIEPGTEPTRHIFHDLPQLRKEFDDWGGNLLFLLVNEPVSGSFNLDDFPGLPEKSHFGWDRNLEFMSAGLPADFSELQYPVIIYVDSLQNIRFMSQGYRIGIGEQIIKNIK